ncbi:MAG: PDZ domain-containing protein [Thermodesulfobacteriota bacterium]
MRLKPSLLSWLWPVLVGLAAAYAAAAWLRPLETPAAPAVAPQAKAPDIEARQAQWASVVKDKNIMRLAVPAPAAAPPPPPPVDPSSWPVLGIVSGDRPAALVNAGGAVKSLRPGEAEQGWTLDRVESDKVVWRHAEVEKEVSLRAEAAKSLQLTAQKTNKISLPAAEAAPLLGNPGLLLQQAQFKPHLEGGEVLGFRVDNIREASILRRIGLEDGDVILRINGERVNAPEKLLRAYASLGRGRTATMDLQRGGSVLAVILEMN